MSQLLRPESGHTGNAARNRSALKSLLLASSALACISTGAWADCSSTDGTIGTDGTSLCIGPSTTPATTTGAGSLAIGNGVSASTAVHQQGVIDYRDLGGPNVPLPNGGAANSSPSGTALGQNSTVGGGGGVSIGDNNSAGTGAAQFNSTAIGVSNAASGAYSVAIGQANQATDTAAVAIGTANQANGNRSIALGRQSYANGLQSMAEGFVASAYGDNAIALGTNSVAGISGGTAVNDVAIGNGASATGGSSVALGAGALANGGQAVSIGTGNTATGNGAVAIGDPSIASGTGAFAGGANNNVFGDGTVGIGNANTVNSAAAPALGSVALGNGNTAVGQGSVALGNGSSATGSGSLAFGDAASATQVGGVALGSGAIDGVANQTNGTVALATPGAVTLDYANGTGVNGGTVSVGSGTGANAYRQVQNVADGSAAHDAVTVQQLAGVASDTNAALAPLQAGARLAVQYTPDGAGNPTAAIDLTKAGTLAPVAVTGLAPATSSTGAVALGQLPVQYSTAGAATTPNPGVPSNDVTLVGAAAGPIGLHNLAPGSLTASSTDAVNGGQIATLGQSVATRLGGGSTFDPVGGDVSAPGYQIRGSIYNDVGSALTAVDNSLGTLGAGSDTFAADSSTTNVKPVATGTAASAGGYGASARGSRSTVVGTSATDNGIDDSTLLGANASVAAGATGSNVALGSGSIASVGALTTYQAFGLTPAQTSVGEVSVGAPGALRRITNVAAGRDATDAANVAQLQGASQGLGDSLASALGGSASYNPASGQVVGQAFTVNGTTYNNVTSAFGALSSSVAASPVQYSTAGAPTTPNPGVASNDVTLVGAAAGPVGLHNVRAGRLAAGSTDAVNGGQLYSTGSSVASVLGGGASYDPATGLLTNPNYTINGAGYATVGGALAALDGSVNGGAGVKYFHSNSTGADSSATGTDSVAAGPTAVASGTDAVAVGSGATAAGENSVALGANSTDGGLANVVSVGAVGAERRVVNVASGTLSAGSTDAVNGGQLYDTNQQVALLGHRGVQYDVAGSGQTLSSVTLNADEGGPVVIHNVAPGVAATDAATVGQIQVATANGVQYDTVNGIRSNTVTFNGGGPGAVTLQNVAPGVNGTDAVNVNQLTAVSNGMIGQANAYTDRQVSNLRAYTDDRIDDTRKRAAAGTAAALAAASLRYDDHPGKTAVSGGIGYWQGQAGLAMGLGRTSEDGRVRVNAAVTVSPTLDRPQVGGSIGGSLTLD